MHGNSGKIAVAVSGGVDSLVSAFLLKQQGFDIFGVHFITGYETPSGQFDPRHRIDHLTRLLDIQIHAVDIREIFEKRVVAYFVNTYLSGKTPNPCMLCNREIKFGIMLDHAQTLGASRVATGHYASVVQAETGEFHLKKGVDALKDQSYFLAMLSQAQLGKACFVLGDKTKQEVIDIARANNLQPFFKKESQDICFIRGVSCQAFLESRLQRRFENGDIVDSSGIVIGRHQGLFRYTIGQRRGINCPASQPYYVLSIDVHQNRLVVGFQDELYKKRCRISNINWVTAKPEGPVFVKTRIRYRHDAVESILTPEDGDYAIIDFQTPQSAVTPGQAAVCCQGDVIVAGGWIE
jgi:tRNA-uridine 2-sulfurtransferase